MAAVVAVAFAVGCQSGEPVPQAAAPVPQASFAQDVAAFWSEFRRAMLADDIDRLSRMTRFPLEVRGETDADPVVRVDRAQLKGTVSRIIAQDSGMGAQQETVRQFIERTPSIKPTSVEPDGGAARVGDFVFERVDGRWLLVRVYAR